MRIKNGIPASPIAARLFSVGSGLQGLQPLAFWPYHESSALGVNFSQAHLRPTIDTCNFLLATS